MGRVEGLGIVDTPPGNERIAQSIIALADASSSPRARVALNIRA